MVKAELLDIPGRRLGRGERCRLAVDLDRVPLDHIVTVIVAAQLLSVLVAQRERVE
jgi:hypothetical protein